MDKIFVFLACLICAIAAKSAAKRQQCFVPGECLKAVNVGTRVSENHKDCLKFCQESQDCNWFTFHPTSNICNLLRNCPTLESTGCPDCVSGERDCIVSVCWIVGECLGTLIHSEENVATKEACLELCQNFEGCNWFTYHTDAKYCALIEDCPAIDEQCTSCISGEKTCTPPMGFSKLLIVGHSEIVEVMDLKSMDSTCQNLPNFIDSRFAFVGGLNSNNEPLVCGGQYGPDYEQPSVQCHTYSNNTWKETHSMMEGRVYASAVNFKAAADANFFVTGGLGVGYNDSAEYLTSSGWVSHPVRLPKRIYGHCLVKLDETSLMIIGGFEYENDYLNDVYIFNNDTQLWTPAPFMNEVRRYHACGKFLLEGADGKYAVAAIGGSYKLSLKTVEIFDLEAQTWKKGPPLPYGNYGGFAVTDHDGKLFYLAGGKRDIFQLSYDGEHGEWIKLPQTMSVSREFFSAFFVPDEITNCEK